MRKLYTPDLRAIRLIFLSVLALISTQLLNAQTVVINTGTAGTPAYNAGPIYRSASSSAYDASRYVYLYTQSELAAAGILPGSVISEVGWAKENPATTTGGAIFRIYMKNSTAADFSNATETWANLNSGATMVYENTNQTIPATAYPSFITFTLNNSFIYTGGSLEISTEWDISQVSGNPTTDSFDWMWSTVNDRIYGAGNTSMPSSLSSTTNSISTIDNRRPYVQITFTPGSPCTTPPTPGTATSSVSSGVCSGTTVSLNLTGNSVGSGQSYQWQSSTSSGGPFTDMGSSLQTPGTNIQPTTTLWYRVAVTCSGNTSFSTPVQVMVNPLFPGGSYTINNNQPTGGTNFNSFADAVSAISCGIAGPVVFNVVAGSGPYSEQVIVPQIPNSSTTNTVTFNGNGATLQATPVTSARHIFWLEGADFIRIKKLNITGQSSTYGWGVYLSGGANNNIIDSCSIDISSVTSTTIDNSAGIVVSGSVNDLNADGDASNNIFSGNTITGGYQGIIVNGTAGSANGVDNTISKNLIKDFYANGIEITDQDHAVVTGNDIQRANRTGVTTFEGIELGTGNINCEISANRIHDTHNNASSQSGAAYGIYITGDDAPAGSPNLVFNNVIYNFNSGTGSQYGLYNSSSNGVHYYHNTIVLDNASSTSGLTRGFYQITTASDIEFRNNIVYITRGGTGTKHALYFSTSTSTIVSDNNVLFVNASGSTVGIGSLGTTNYATLADWQAANSNAYDQQSQEADPLFASPSTGNFYPNNTAIASMGTAAGVTVDIVGTPRDLLTPTPGAWEIVAATGADMGVKTLLSPIQKNCYSSNETVTVTIRNYSANPINFATKPTTVNVSVAGPNATTFTPVVVNTGSLASDDTLDVVISTTYDMSAPGTYVFDASTSVTGDASSANDAMFPVTVVVDPLVAGSAASNPPSYCVTGGIPTVTLTGNTGGSIQWQTASSAAGPWTNVGSNDPVYTPATAITSTTYYQAIVNCGTNADTSNLVEVLLSNPEVLSTMSVTRCGPGTVPLSATPNAGATIEWYTDATGGTPIATGNSFTTPILNATTTYYVSAMQGGGLQPLGVNSITDLPNAGTNSSFTAGLEFTADVPVQIQSVDIFPTAAIGTNFQIVVRSGSGSGAVVATYQDVTTVQGSVASPVAQTVPVNFNLPPGDYVMTFYNGQLQPPASGNAVYPGALRNNPATGATFPYTIPGLISITSGTATNSWYYFYNWQIVTGCHSARQAVTATISPAPALTLTQETTICNNAIKALTVTSPLTNFDTYTWSPATGLYTDAAATNAYTDGTSASTVYIKTNAAGTYTYVLTANNNSSSCQNIDSVKVTVLPDAVTISTSNAALCTSGSTTLSLQPNSGYGTAGIQWMISTDGGTSYSPIGGAVGVDYTTPVLTATTMYKAVISDNSGNSCLQPAFTVNVSNPQVLTTTDGARCDVGPVTLAATSSPNTTLNWYDAPTGGTLVGTGTTFVTPSLNATTNYYVSAFQTSSTLTAGRVAPLPNSSGFNGDNYGLIFNASVPFTLTSVDVYPSSTTAETVEVQLTTSGGTVLYTAGPFNLPAGTGSTVSGGATPVTLNLGFAVPVGNGYRLRTENLTGKLIRDNPIGSNFSYPLDIGNVGSITSGLLAGSSSAASYWFFYNWQVSTGCASPRQAVTAMISGTTTILQQPASVSTCAGSAVSFAVNATGANLTYQWRKNGAPVSGATGPTYTIFTTAPGDAGDYDVVITGLCGNATSSTASLTVASSNTWLGTSSTDWNNPSNWCGGVPTPTSDVEISAGTPFQPVVNGVGNVHQITINNGAVVTVSPTGFLNIYGDLVNSGSFTSNGAVAFKGSAVQNIGTSDLGHLHMNGAGIVLTGDITANNLVLTTGNITLGNFNLGLAASSEGTSASHVITNGTGSVTALNVNASPVTVPVGPDATGYNPVTISNGQGRDYSVKVATGINPAINNPSRAINRTWNIQTNTTGISNVTLLFQYESGDANASASPTAVMEAGVHNGTSWNIVAPSVTPSGTGSTWQVGLETTQFGPMVLANVGGISYPTATPNIDPAITQVTLMPTLVQSNALLRVKSVRADKMEWKIIDVAGRVVLHFNKDISAGSNDIHLQLGQLAAGVYHILGISSRGLTPVIRFVKQ